MGNLKNELGDLKSQMADLKNPVRLFVFHCIVNAFAGWVLLSISVLLSIIVNAFTVGFGLLGACIHS